MNQKNDPKIKAQAKPYSRETYTDRRARMFESSAVRHAKQLGFLTGEDVLKFAETELVSSQGTNKKIK